MKSHKERLSLHKLAKKIQRDNHPAYVVMDHVSLVQYVSRTYNIELTDEQGMRLIDLIRW